MPPPGCVRTLRPPGRHQHSASGELSVGRSVCYDNVNFLVGAIEVVGRIVGEDIGCRGGASAVTVDCTSSSTAPHFSLLPLLRRTKPDGCDSLPAAASAEAADFRSWRLESFDDVGDRLASVGLSSSWADDGAPSVSVLLALSLVRPSASSVSDMPCTEPPRAGSR